MIASYPVSPIVEQSQLSTSIDASSFGVLKSLQLNSEPGDARIVRDLAQGIHLDAWSIQEKENQ